EPSITSGRDGRAWGARKASSRVPNRCGPGREHALRQPRCLSNPLRKTGGFATPPRDGCTFVTTYPFASRLQREDAADLTETLSLLTRQRVASSVGGDDRGSMRPAQAPLTSPI